jgi:NNP family nitrate/nitrite transporter-like MFS transporter
MRRLDSRDRRPHCALWVSLAFYAVCIAMTWWFSLRKSFMAKQVPSPAEARV